MQYKLVGTITAGALLVLTLAFLSLPTPPSPQDELSPLPDIAFQVFHDVSHILTQPENLVYDGPNHTFSGVKEKAFRRINEQTELLRDIENKDTQELYSLLKQTFPETPKENNSNISVNMSQWSKVVKNLCEHSPLQSEEFQKELPVIAINLNTLFTKWRNHKGRLELTDSIESCYTSQVRFFPKREKTYVHYYNFIKMKHYDRFPASVEKFRKEVEPVLALCLEQAKPNDHCTKYWNDEGLKVAEK